MLSGIKGFQPSSFSDYPGKIAAVIFTGGCNLRCRFCHNPDLVLHYRDMPDIPEEKILNHLEKRRRWLDGVVLSGGEPLMHRHHLYGLLEKIKNMGYSVCIETNGHFPDTLEHVIDAGLVNYIALDFKAPLLQELWEQIAGTESNVKLFKKSLSIVQNSELPCQLRLTRVPGFHSDHMLAQAREQAGESLVIQPFRPGRILDPALNDQDIESSEPPLEDQP